MNFEPLLNQIYNMLWYLVPLFILMAVIKSAWFKGVFGEFQVNLAFKLFLPKDDYQLFKNVTLPTKDGSTQIDHILVSRYGVFVIETKNMKGWIFGSENQKQWTQKIFRHSSKFQNPLHQNYKHLKTLEVCLDIESSSLFSVVVFVGDSEFKTEMPDNVTYAGGCIRYVKSKSVALLSDKQVSEVASAIEQGMLKQGFATNRKHVAHVKQLVKSKPSTDTCSKCGSDMVLRESKKGKHAGNKFWGCSSFPKCRNIQPANLGYED